MIWIRLCKYRGPPWNKLHTYTAATGRLTISLAPTTSTQHKLVKVFISTKKKYELTVLYYVALLSRNVQDQKVVFKQSSNLTSEIIFIVNASISWWHYNNYNCPGLDAILVRIGPSGRRSCAVGLYCGLLYHLLDLIHQPLRQKSKQPDDMWA